MTRLTLAKALLLVMAWQQDHVHEFTDPTLIAAFLLVNRAAMELYHLRDTGVIPKDKLLPMEQPEETEE